MPGKKLTQEDKEKIFQRIVEIEKDPYWRRRYIQQWHEGRLKIYKKRGRICWHSPSDFIVDVSAATGLQVFHYSDLERPLTKEEREKLDKKEKIVEGEGKLVSLDEYVK